MQIFELIHQKPHLSALGLRVIFHVAASVVFDPIYGIAREVSKGSRHIVMISLKSGDKRVGLLRAVSAMTMQPSIDHHGPCVRVAGVGLTLIENTDRAHRAAVFIELNSRTGIGPKKISQG